MEPLVATTATLTVSGNDAILSPRLVAEATAITVTGNEAVLGQLAPDPLLAETATVTVTGNDAVLGAGAGRIAIGASRSARSNPAHLLSWPKSKCGRPPVAPT